MLTTHLIPRNGFSNADALSAAQILLKNRYGIEHVTLQVDPKLCQGAHD
jgi:Co/Zn/Cd efflux system component